MYKPTIARIKLVGDLDARMPQGASLTPTDAAIKVKAMLPPYRSPAGYGAQSVARVLCENYGWRRTGRLLVKPMPEI